MKKYENRPRCEKMAEGGEERRSRKRVGGGEPAPRSKCASQQQQRIGTDIFSSLSLSFAPFAYLWTETYSTHFLPLEHCVPNSHLLPFASVVKVLSSLATRNSHVENKIKITNSRLPPFTSVTLQEEPQGLCIPIFATHNCICM
jgi:hypothetical protein